MLPSVKTIGEFKGSKTQKRRKKRKIQDEEEAAMEAE
jgi:hypothetical protein